MEVKVTWVENLRARVEFWKHGQLISTVEVSSVEYDRRFSIEVRDKFENPIAVKTLRP